MQHNPKREEAKSKLYRKGTKIAKEYKCNNLIQAMLLLSFFASFAPLR